jgi:hypothetical protein
MTNQADHVLSIGDDVVCIACVCNGLESLSGKVSIQAAQEHVTGIVHTEPSRIPVVHVLIEVDCGCDGANVDGDDVPDDARWEAEVRERCGSSAVAVR